MTEETAGNRLTYAAFISYSHADNRQEGRKWADWLHHELETYEVPAELVGKPNRAGQPIAAQIYPVFQDEKELSASASLSSALTAALDASSYLVYLSSPQSARSVYVSEELRRFKQTGKGDRIIALILAGEPEYGVESSAQQCFPEVLRYRVDESGNIDHSERQEPIAADVRLPGTQEQGFTTPEAYRQSLQGDRTLSRKEVERRVQAYKDRLDLAKLKIIAGVLDVPLGDLTQRDQAYQLIKARQRTKIVKRIAIVIGLLALMAMALGVYAWTERNAAQSMLSRSLFLSGLNKIDQKEVAEGAAYMAAATRYGNERTALFVQSMLMRENGMTLMPRLESAPVFSPDGHWLAAVDATSNAKRGVQIWDAHAQKLHTILSDANASPLSKMKFDNRNVLYFTRADNKIASWQEGGAVNIVYEGPADMRLAYFAPDASGRWLVVQGWAQANGALQHIKSKIVNMRTGQVAVEEVPTRRGPSSTAERVVLDDHGRAIVFYDTAGDDNPMRIYPVNTKGELEQARDYLVPGAITGLKFSPDSRHVFALAVNGMYHIDLQRDDRSVSKVPAQFAPDDVYFSENGKTYTTLWGGRYTVHEMETDRVLSSGETGINLARLLRDDSPNVSPDMTQRVEKLEGSFYLMTDLAPALLRSQFELQANLVSLLAMPDSTGVLLLKKNSRSLQFLALDEKQGIRDFVSTPSEIERFGVIDDNDLVYTVSIPEKNGRSQLRFFRAATGKSVGKPMSVKGMLSFSHDGK
ncbi:MAG TPA: toll/interleukin-1 receptor domain-containing protein, partial [Advenella sp.]|nr:toll/interleukin-1 receptor domain-containing protein [Advenella sp.]